MFFAFGFFDGNAVKKEEKTALCPVCGYDGLQPPFVKRKWVMLFFVPLPVKNTSYLECPRCGSMQPYQE